MAKRWTLHCEVHNCRFNVCYRASTHQHANSIPWAIWTNLKIGGRGWSLYIPSSLLECQCFPVLFFLTFEWTKSDDLKSENGTFGISILKVSPVDLYSVFTNMKRILSFTASIGLMELSFRFSHTWKGFWVLQCQSAWWNARMCPCLGYVLGGSDFDFETRNASD